MSAGPQGLVVAVRSTLPASTVQPGPALRHGAGADVVEAAVGQQVGRRLGALGARDGGGGNGQQDQGAKGHKISISSRVELHIEYTIYEDIVFT
jgi:hypothetical protein